MCAVFGLIDYANHFTARQREKVLKVLSKECESRGTDATGFAFNYRHGMTIYKKPIAAHRMRLHLPQESNIILGHTRMATQGDKKDNFNNHPFSGRTGATGFALAHNGVLHNDFRLQKQYNLPATNIETDSYVAVQLLEQSMAEADLDMKDKLIGEKNYIFSRALKYLPSLVERNFVFTECADIKDVLANYAELQDLLPSFVKDCCEIGEGLKVHNKDILIAVRNYYRDNGMLCQMNDNQIINRLIKLSGAVRGKFRLNGPPLSGLKNICLK